MNFNRAAFQAQIRSCAISEVHKATSIPHLVSLVNSAFSGQTMPLPLTPICEQVFSEYAALESEEDKYNYSLYAR